MRSIFRVTGIRFGQRGFGTLAPVLLLDVEGRLSGLAEGSAPKGSEGFEMFSL